MQKAPSGVVTLPGWLKSPVKKLYNTRSGGQYRPDDVALAFALSLRFHDSADHLRRLARRLVDKVCLEHQPNMKRLAREPDDAKVFDAALKIINRVCDLLEYAPGTAFVRNGGDDGQNTEAA
ncbi:hypothetical protein [Pseudomonas asiatica]|uniref:DUF7740 domain-containing protein n=1 Tax=Pseudomonas asiatica TaxID=2219225 RepID=UPI001AAE6415|nr:hypothetical protein [Pseudomonas asiatica]MBO2889523.1 hypothetical protein [Pseudomonas asiatica]